MRTFVANIGVNAAHCVPEPIAPGMCGYLLHACSLELFFVGLAFKVTYVMHLLQMLEESIQVSLLQIELNN